MKSGLTRRKSESILPVGFQAGTQKQGGADEKAKIETTTNQLIHLFSPINIGLSGCGQSRLSNGIYGKLSCFSKR